MRKIFISLIGLSLLGILTVAAFAKIEIPGRTNSRVNDYAGVIDEETKKYLENLISSIKQKTPDPIEIVVATFQSLEGWEFGDFSLQYGEKWRAIKQNKRDNGVIILVVINDRRVGIGVGKNLEGILTQRVTNDIIQGTILPYFRAGNYPEGIKKAVGEIIEILDKADIPSGNNMVILLGITALVGLIIITVFLLRKR